MNEDETPIPIEQILDVEKVMQIRRIVRRIKISAEIKRYIERLVLATRPEASALDSVKKFVRYGASDRSAVTLMKAARAQAFEQGRASVLPEDVLAVAHWVLDHRVILSYEAEGDGGTTQEKVVEEILKNVPPVTAK